MRLRPFLPLAGLLLALGGCRMIDQRTFARAPVGPDAAAQNRPVLPKLPVARLRPDDPQSDWRATLDAAVQSAIAHNPDARFELLTPIPTAAARDVQDRFASAGAAAAGVVAAALRQDGVDPAHITIGYQGDAGKPAPEVRLFVR